MFERDAVCQFCYQGQEYQDYVCGNDSDCTVLISVSAVFALVYCCILKVPVSGHMFASPVLYQLSSVVAI